MVDLVFGDKKQLQFKDKKEFFITLGVCCNSQVVSISYEPNKRTGSYADAYRIRILAQAKELPEALKKATKTGNRINCNKFVEYLINEFAFIQNGSKVSGVLENVIKLVPQEYVSCFVSGYKNHSSKQLTKSYISFETEEVAENISTIKKVSIPKRVSESKNKTIKADVKKTKIDYIKKQIDDTLVGNLGEKLVFEYESKRIEKLSKKDSSFKKLKPIWVSLEDDNLGYDILSYNENKEEIFIEVKSTKAGKYTNFYISKNEVEFSKANSKNYYLYRVFGLSTTKEVANFYVIEGDVSNSLDIELQEMNYIAKLK